MPTVSHPSYLSSADAAAEREAEAIERLADMLDEPVQLSRLQLAMAQAREAVERGLPSPKRHPYAWIASCKAHARLATAPMSRLVWSPPPSKLVPSENDRLRRAARRIQRQSLLEQLQSQPAARWVGTDAASKLTGIGTRTIQRAVLQGRIPSRRQFGHGGRGDTGKLLVRVRDLRDLLARKLAGHPVAA